jgi:hypothetical protein
MRTASLVLAGLMAVAVASHDASAASLIHHFDFNGASVTDSVGGASGTLLSGATLAGGSLVLDGLDDYVQIGQKVVPAGLTAFSVTVRAQQNSVQTFYAEMISQGFSGGPGFYIGHEPDRKFRVSDQFCCGIISATFPGDGAFHLYSVTSDGTGTRFYLDSALVFSSATQMNITSGGTDTRFGRQFGGFTEFFHGRIDDARIYSGALTGAEVSALNAAFASVPAPAPVLLLAAAITGLGFVRLRRAA